jgi:hypothetical protein
VPFKYKAKLLTAYREAGDYANPLNLPADLAESLHRWSYDGLKWSLSSEDVRQLIQKTPFEGGDLYRGMNFKTQESYENFMAVTQNGTQYTDEGWSSWTPHEGESHSFAVTWPTYHLNRELMRAEDEKSRNRDHMIGYQGVILKTTVGAGIGADIRPTGFSHESEIILPAGNYPMEIVENFKPFKRSIPDQSTAEQELLAMKSLGTGGRDDLDYKKFTFILHNFTEFTDAGRAHLGKLIPVPKEVRVELETREGSQYQYRAKGQPVPKYSEVWMYDNIPEEMVAYYPLLLDNGQERIRKFVSAILREKIKKLSEFIKGNPDINWSLTKINDNSRDIESIADTALLERYRKLLRSKFRSDYKDLDNLVKQINQVNRGEGERKQRDMLEEYTERIKIVLENMAKVGSSKKAFMSEEDAESQVAKMRRLLEKRGWKFDEELVSALGTHTYVHVLGQKEIHVRTLEDPQGFRPKWSVLELYKAISLSSGTTYSSLVVELERLSEDKTGSRKIAARPIPDDVLVQINKMRSFLRKRGWHFMEEITNELGDPIYVYVPPDDLDEDMQAYSNKEFRIRPEYTQDKCSPHWVLVDWDKGAIGVRRRGDSLSGLVLELEKMKEENGNNKNASVWRSHLFTKV